MTDFAPSSPHVKRNSRQTFETLAAFDEKSTQWDQNYAPDGRMSARIGRFVGELREHVPPPAQVLDFGCGTGQIARALAKAGWEVTGCDISKGMLDHAPKSGVRWVELDAAAAPALPFADAAFEAVIASSVLEYLSDPAVSLLELARVIRPGGWILFTVPNLRHPLIWREELIRFGISLGPLWFILRRSRWRVPATCLRVSVNRHSFRWWQGLLVRSGFEPTPSGRCEGPLSLLAAQRTT